MKLSKCWNNFMIFMLQVVILSSTFTFAEEINKTFKEEVEFLQKHTDVIVLSDKSGEKKVAVVPAYQGRVMTSTANGDQGISFGWINRDLIASGELKPQINVFGGEDRFWMGPEGGQYAIFFQENKPFEFKYWQTPPVIDTEPFHLVSKNQKSATFAKDAELTNRFGTEFKINIERTICLIDTQIGYYMLGIQADKQVKMVAFESVNKITNNGDKAWEKGNGLLSIWILGMFNSTPGTTVVIPFKSGDDDELGPKVNDAYFGKVPEDRLKANDNILFFKGDSNFRSKIGVSPKRAQPKLGSYDSINNILTIVQYTRIEDAIGYVNSEWKLQEKPYDGDVINAYNDGPLEEGKEQLGHFFELESSSPAVELKPKESLEHIHRTFHFVGAKENLDKISMATLGTSLEEIEKAL